MTTRAEEIAAQGPYADQWSDREAGYVVTGPTEDGTYAMSEGSAKVYAMQLNAAYKQGQQDRWISVEERLPEVGSAVMVYPHPHICRYGPWDYYGVEQVAGFHSWDGANDTDSIVPGVTHWMPLPSPPNPEQR